MLIVEKNSKSISAEAYKTLRTNIQYSSFDKEIKTILVTSTIPGEGKSTIAGNLALSFAQQDKKVLVIDCDLRKPSLHKIFKLSNLKGLSDIIVGNSDLEKAMYNYKDNFDILTSGKIPPNPSEILASNAMTALLEKLKTKYDIIIIDSAPLQAVTDAQIISNKVDGTLLVIRAGVTKREAILQAKELLNKVNAKILGVVLNGVENNSEKHYYYYGSKEESR
ncbi:MAG: CpsD/CapB family tyrosine-protein kinase [Clostridium sp.]|nr:CpsD/CapB family tyrosine-protein kinase [Clostridium sp.]